MLFLCRRNDKELKGDEKLFVVVCRSVNDDIRMGFLPLHHWRVSPGKCLAGTTTSWSSTNHMTHLPHCHPRFFLFCKVIFIGYRMIIFDDYQHGYAAKGVHQAWHPTLQPMDISQVCKCHYPFNTSNALSRPPGWIKIESLPPS